MEEDKIYEVALSMVPGIGAALSRQLISYCGTAKLIFNSKAATLQKIPGIGEKSIKALKNIEVMRAAEKEVEGCYKKNIHILFFTNSGYPSRLKQIYDAPIVLYFKGEGNLNFPKTIGIVGTRQSTEYGKEVIYALMKDLKKYSPLIVSGLAYGIDILSHKAALNNHIPTVGVTASGLDYIYPAAHKEIAIKMLEEGGVLTEKRLGVKPDAYNFPERNRIIAGMCDAILVIEAMSKGGALITAELANGYNKDVFAVPGNIGNKASEGCNNLIKSHKANIMTSIKDLEYIMNWDTPVKAKNNKSLPDEQMATLPENEKIVINLLTQTNNGIHIDEISWKTQIPINQVASILLNLEFKSLVKSLPGKKFRLNLF